MMCRKCLGTLIYRRRSLQSELTHMKSITQFFKKKALSIEKRYRFALAVLFLTGIIFVSTFFNFDKAIYFIPIFILITYLATYFSIMEGIEKIEWFMLFLMPIAMTISFYLFYFLFPGRWLTRLPFLLIFAISTYATFLCSNIFNVGVEKSLQLYRAAFSVNFFYQTFVLFLILNVIFSFSLNFVFNSLLVLLISFVLSLQLFWTIRLKLVIEKEMLFFALFLSLALSQVSLVLSFVPLNASIFALFLSAAFYSLCGLMYTYLDQRLFKETVREYLLVLGFVSLIVLLSLNW